MNKKLEEIFKGDQQDRLNPLFNKKPKFFIKRDAIRRKKIQEIFQKGGLKTGRDYYIAAMIFHHGPTIKDAKRAITFSQKSFEFNYNKARWLCAATVDRLLTKKGKRQKFGTQFFKKTQKSSWVLRPINLKTTDAERAKFNVSPLKEIKKTLKQMNKTRR